MPEEKKILRFGEWVEKNWVQYTQYLDVLVPGNSGPLLTHSGDNIVLNISRRQINFIDGYSFVRLIKDYDKYLDDNLVL